MNFSLSLSWILLPFAFASVMAYGLYFFKPGLPPKIRYPLASLRWMTVFFIGLLLLDPSIKKVKQIQDKPEILFFQDNSQSILLGSQKNLLKEGYSNKVKSLIINLSKKYRVHSYSFGSKLSDSLKFNFQENQTDFSSALNLIQDQYQGRNIGSIIIASDGIFNRGEDLSKEILKTNVPIYTIALGDTSAQKDLAVNKVDYNEVVFMGDQFPIKVSLSARNCLGKSVNVMLKQFGKIIQKKEVKVTSLDAHLFVSMEASAHIAGPQLFQIEIEGIPGEITYGNNHKSFLINALKSKQEILLLSAVSNPDISAWRQALEKAKNFSVRVHTYKDQDIGDIKNYTCVIWYQMPFLEFSHLGPEIQKQINLLPSIKIIGKQTLPVNIENLKENLIFSPLNSFQNINIDDFNSNFRGFTINDSLKKIIPNFPPLEGNFQVNLKTSSDNIIAYSVVPNSKILTKQPILFLNEFENKKSIWFLGEGIWKWRASEFEQTGKSNLVDYFLQHLVSLISLQTDPSKFRVILPKSIWNPNEPISLEAELYNSSYELINISPVTLEIKNEKGMVFHFSFSREKNKYQLNLGQLPIGLYHYSAIAKNSIPLEIRNGVFQVEANSQELENTIANYSLLRNISKNTNGQMVMPNQINDLDKLIIENPQIKSRLHETKSIEFWIEIPVILTLIIFLLALEWGIRKWNGSY